MIGKRISWISFVSILTIIALSVVARAIGALTTSNLILGAAMGAFLIFSWAQRKIKEDMLPFVSKEYKESEWKYFLSSIVAFILVIFSTLLNIFILFLGMPISAILITVLLGAVILLMLYTVLSIPTVEESRGYTILFLIAFAFTAIVIGSQMDIGIHLPENAAPLLKNMSNPLFLLNIALLFEVFSLMLGGEMPTPTQSVIGVYERTKFREERPMIMRRNVIYLAIVIFIVLFILANIITIVGLPGSVQDNFGHRAPPPLPRQCNRFCNIRNIICNRSLRFL